MSGLAYGLTAFFLIAAIVSAAKTHGRQVRLRREAEGHMEVAFGQDNGPFVNALWRRDRIVFWCAFGTLVAGLGVAPLLVWWDDFSVGRAVANFLMATGSAAVLAFVGTAIGWAVALLRSGRRVGHIKWWGTTGWVVLSLVLALAAMTVAEID